MKFGEVGKYPISSYRELSLTEAPGLSSIPLGRTWPYCETSVSIKEPSPLGKGRKEGKGEGKPRHVLLYLSCSPVLESRLTYGTTIVAERRRLDVLLTQWDPSPSFAVGSRFLRLGLELSLRRQVVPF